MTTPADIQAVNINNLKRFSPDARVNQLVLNSKDLVTRMNCYEPGQITPKHVHPDDDEIVFCVEGRGAVKFDGRDAVPLIPGAIVNLPAGLAHWIEAASDSRMVVLYWANARYTSVRMHSEPGYGGARLPGEQPPSPGSLF
jgi:quercetin dioxygenase-like cupin family protein